MKIGLTGPSGSGKTTLANYIAEITGLKFIPGSASLITDPEQQEYLKKEFDYEPMGHKAVIRKSNENPDFGYAFQMALLRSRVNTLSTEDNFITDRTPLDNLSYFMLQCAVNQTELTCQNFITECQWGMGAGITHLIIVKPNEGWTEDNGSRVANNFHQHMTYSVFMGVFERYFESFCARLGIKVLLLDTWDWQTRKTMVQGFLQL
jgi:hypothetical protein